MSITIEARMQMIGPIAASHAEEVRPTVEAWAQRADNLSAFMREKSSAALSPITAFVSSERQWRDPA